MTCNLRHPMGLRHPVSNCVRSWQEYFTEYYGCIFPDLFGQPGRCWNFVTRTAKFAAVVFCNENWQTVSREKFVPHSWSDLLCHLNNNSNTRRLLRAFCSGLHFTALVQPCARVHLVYYGYGMATGCARAFQSWFDTGRMLRLDPLMQACAPLVYDGLHLINILPNLVSCYPQTRIVSRIIGCRPSDLGQSCPLQWFRFLYNCLHSTWFGWFKWACQ